MRRPEYSAALRYEITFQSLRLRTHVRIILIRLINAIYGSFMFPKHIRSFLMPPRVDNV